MRWPLVRITWLDSQGPYGWNSLKQILIKDDLSVESVGWVLEETEDRITLAAHVSMAAPDNPHVDGVMTIPLRAVVARMVLVGVS